LQASISTDSSFENIARPGKGLKEKTSCCDENGTVKGNREVLVTESERLARREAFPSIYRRIRSGDSKKSSTEEKLNQESVLLPLVWAM